MTPDAYEATRDAVFELLPFTSTCTAVVFPRRTSRPNPGSTRTTTSTLPESSTGATSISDSGVASTSNRFEPTNFESSSRLCGVRSWSIQAIAAFSTSRFTAYPKIKSWMIGGTKSMALMRGSRKACRTSLRMIYSTRLLIGPSRHLQPHLANRGPEYDRSVCDEQQRLSPQHCDSDACQENSIDDRDEITRRHGIADHLNDFGHVADRIDETGEQERRQEGAQHAQLIGEQLRAHGGRDKNAPAQCAEQERAAGKEQEPRAAAEGYLEHEHGDQYADQHVHEAERKECKQLAEHQLRRTNGGRQELLHGAVFPFACDRQ